jgi:hypothetical protein
VQIRLLEFADCGIVRFDGQIQMFGATVLLAIAPCIVIRFTLYEFHFPNHEFYLEAFWS